MKTYFTIFALMMVESFACAQLPSAGLVTYYNFNLDLKKDSSRIYDISGNSNHGTVMGSVYYSPDRFGVPCSALFLDGNSYVTVQSSKSLKKPQHALTIAVWFKIAQGANLLDQWITICCKSDQPGETPESPQYRMQATAQTVSINTEFTEYVIPQLKYEQWYFYAYTYDGNHVKVYLDGNYIFEYEYHGILTPNDMPLEIGRDLPGKLEYYFGAMDDLRIYDRALAESELYQLYSDRSEANAEDRCVLHLQPVVPVPKPYPTTPDPTAQVPTPVVTPPAPVDSFAGLPDSIENMPIKYQKTVVVEGREITVYPYDNEKEDGDIVSININGVWVRDQYMIKNKKSNPAKGTLIKCSLESGKNNYLISRAWNLGSIPPNTLTVEINDGHSIQKVVINSEIGLSGGIRIISK